MMVTKKNDNIGTLHSTGEAKVGGIDDMEVDRFMKEQKEKVKKTKENK